MKNIKIFILIFLSTLLIYPQTNYYISSTDGNDSNNGLSKNSAWKTLDKLDSHWNEITAGDSILFERGSNFRPSSLAGGSTRMALIQIPNNKSGTANNPIVLGAYGSGQRPTFEGSNISEYHQILRTGSFGYITIQDLEFRGSVYFRPIENKSVGIHHLRFIRNRVQGGHDPSNDAKLSFYNPYVNDAGDFIDSQVPELNEYAPIDDVEIGWCEFFDTEGQDAVNIGRAGNNLWVHHNIWQDVSEEALDVGGGFGHIIEYNYIFGTTVNGMKFHSQSNPQGNLIVRGNVIIGAGGEIGNGGNALVFQNVVNSQCYNNTIYSLYSAYFGNRDRPQPEAYYGNFEGNEIYNNIFIGTIQIDGSWENAPIGNQILYSAPSINLHRDNVFSNNIYWPFENNEVVIRFWEGNQFPDANKAVNDSRTLSTRDFTKFTNEWANKVQGEFERMIDPALVNAYFNGAYDYGDFSPAENSPAIDSGIPIAGWTEDITGKIIPSGVNPTIGAFQFGSGGIARPRLTKIETLNTSAIKLYFSKTLNENSATNTSNFNINNGIQVNSAEISANGKEITLNTSVHASNTNYTIIVTNITDTDNQSIDPIYSSLSYSFELTSLTLTRAEPINSTSIKLFFSNKLDASSAIDVLNYTIDNNIQIISAELSSNADEVTLQTSEHSANIIYTVTVSNLTDISGSQIDPENSSSSYSFELNKLNVINVEESEADSVDQSTNKDYTVDGNLETRWAAKVMPQFLVFDLGKINTICKTSFSFYKWEENRIYTYSVLVSQDNVIWQEVLSQTESKPEQWSTELFDPVEARYIQLVFHSSTNNSGNWANIWEAEFFGDKIISGQETSPEIPENYELRQNYPNPFNPETTIEFNLPSNNNVNLSVFNTLGQIVKNLLNNKSMNSGYHKINFNASFLPSGVYLYRLTTPEFSQTRKMILLK